MIVFGFRHVRRALSVGILALGLGAATFAGQVRAQTVKLGYVEFLPFTQTENGTAKGTLIDSFDAAAKSAGIAYSAESMPARRLFQAIADGDAHVFLGIRTVKEFEGTTLISRAPIGRIELNAYGIGAAPAIKAKEDLAGTSVIALTGYAYGGWRAFMEDPANKVKIVDARTIDQGLQLLQAGRAPVMLQYSDSIKLATAAASVQNLQATPIQALDVYIIVSKKAPEAEGLLAKLEAGFKATERPSGQ